MQELLAGKAVRALGNPDARHTRSYIPDVARTLIRIGAEERAWGRAWHVPVVAAGVPTRVRRPVCRVAGRKPVTVRPLPWWLVRTIGLAVPMMGELQETRNQFDRPLALDCSAYEAGFGEQATPFDTAITETVRWWQDGWRPQYPRARDGPS